MKKILLLFFILCAFVNAQAQDVIVMKDGTTILSNVLEISTNGVKYKNWANQEGPTFTLPIENIQSINYKNGTRDDLSTFRTNENKTEPQNPYIQFNSDYIDALKQSTKAQDLYSRSRICKIWGWVCIGVGVATAGAGIAAGVVSEETKVCLAGLIPGVAVAVFGGGSLHGLSNKYRNEADRLCFSPILKTDIRYKDLVFSPSLNYITDNTNSNNKAMGVGLSIGF